MGADWYYGDASPAHVPVVDKDLTCDGPYGEHLSIQRDGLG
ncbi:MAG: hypothetical protein H6P94_1068, partial [Thermoplasmatales archaeon]|nr:hypothetical protein [Thermoplasmatales archaeon]